MAMAVTQIAIWPFDAGSGTTIAAAVGGPSIQSFGSSGGWYGNGDGLGEGYRVQYNAAPNATGSDLITGVHGATKLIMCFVFRTGSTAPQNGEVLVGISEDENAVGNRRWTCYYNGSEIRFVFNNGEVLTATTGTTLSTNTLYRLWIVCDTPNATANLRFRMYFQGSAVSATVATVTQNTTLSITTGTDELVCGAPFGAGTVANAGYSHYLGFWTYDTFDETVLLAADDEIEADNDIEDPFDTGGAYTLTANSGSFTLTGAAANLLQGYRLVSDLGSFALTGNAANLVEGTNYSMAANLGSFALSGSAANLLQGYRLAADLGSFALSGAAAGLLQGFRLTADLGSFSLSGAAANLIQGYRMPADLGSFALTGNPAFFLKGRTLLANGGTYAFTGNPALFPRTWRLSADSGTYALTGNPANLLTGANLVMTADLGSFVLTGNQATLRAARALQANTGTFTLTGNAANLNQGYRLVADPGSFVVSGQSALFARGRALFCDTGSYLLQGRDVSFDWDHSKTLFANQGVYVLVGRAATLRYVGALTAFDLAVSLRNRGAPKRPRNWRP
jgi:hypothetical protein